MDTQSLIERAEADLQRIEDVEGNYYDLANVRGALAIAASQAAEIARLREALKPFACLDNSRIDRLALGPDIDHWPLTEPYGLTLGHVRRARAALNGEKP